MLVLASLIASANPAQRDLTWDLLINDKVVGQQTLTVTTEQTRFGELRTLQVSAQVDASVVGIPIQYRHKITANADIGPSSFISVVERSGEISQVQGRRTTTGWIVSISEKGRTSTQEPPVDAIDLSTADLLDPASRVPISRFDRARVISAETGQILEGTVEPLGPTEIKVAGAVVPVETYRWTTPDFAGLFHYTSEGWLVKFETRVLGQRITGILRQPPPTSPDDGPIDVFGPGVEGTPL